MLNVVQKSELLNAMRECLIDLENAKLMSPDDLDIIDQRRVLRQLIIELENEDCGGYHLVA